MSRLASNSFRGISLYSSASFCSFQRLNNNSHFSMSLNQCDSSPNHMVLSETQRCPLFSLLLSLNRTSSWSLSKFQWLYLCCWLVANAWTFIHLLVWKIGGNTAQAVAAMWGVEHIKVGGLWETGGERGGGRWRVTIWCTSVVHKQNPKLVFFSSLLNCVLNMFFSNPHGHFSTTSVEYLFKTGRFEAGEVFTQQTTGVCVCVCVPCLYVKQSWDRHVCQVRKAYKVSHTLCVKNWCHWCERLWKKKVLM